MSEVESVTLETELTAEQSEREISHAVSSRQSIARKYVLWIRRRNPEATPADVISLIERHYATSITAAGAAIAAGAIAADVGISMIPVAGPAVMGARSAGQQAAKRAGKEVVKQAAKQAAKNAALGAARQGASKAAGLLPAGDEQLQFEITAIFALALADIHGMTLDQSQAHALVYGLSNERVSQNQIAEMAKDVSLESRNSVALVGQNISEGREDWSHWASTLADSLPGSAAKTLVQTVQSGQLDSVRQTLSGKQQATIEYGVGAIVGGVSRFVFGREVVNAARSAFAEAPAEFPRHLVNSPKVKAEKSEVDAEPSRALAALESAAQASGSWITGTANAVGLGAVAGAANLGSGVASTASAATRVFRSVDLDGDGIPDEAVALTKVKIVGGAISDTAGSVGNNLTGLFKRKMKASKEGLSNNSDIELPNQEEV